MQAFALHLRDRHRLLLEAAAASRTEYHHDLEIIILDRPDLTDGTQVQGPISDPA